MDVDKQNELVGEEQRLQAAGKVANELGIKTTNAYRIIAAYKHPTPSVAQEPVLQRVMGRLADLLDEDQFAEIEGMVVRAGISPPLKSTPAVAVDHSGLIERIDAAIDRVTQGRGLMSIPADPRSDVDLVLSECKALLEGENPPFWAKDFHPAQPVQPAGGQGEFSWATGEPPKWFEEWFIAKLDNGQKVVLKRLPEDFTYDYTTADETYYAKRRIAKWMQFPDSEFVSLNPSPAVAVNKTATSYRLVPVEPTQAMKAAGQKRIDELANDGIKRYWQDVYAEGYKAMLDVAPTAPAVAVNEHLSERENAVLNFALRQFLSNAYLHMNAAAQDKEGKRYPKDASSKFHDDAKTTEALLERFERIAAEAAKKGGVCDE